VGTRICISLNDGSKESEEMENKCGEMHDDTLIIARPQRNKESYAPISAIQVAIKYYTTRARQVGAVV
jgi:hypothetical protein